MTTQIQQVSLAVFGLDLALESVSANTVKLHANSPEGSSFVFSLSRQDLLKFKAMVVMAEGMLDAVAHKDFHAKNLTLF